ncbi:MAG: hypothetical protein ACO21S_09105 [Sediminibacterium sp.]|jgi:hypothetical protein
MNKIPRGYTITPKVKYLRTKDGKKRTNLVELTNKRRGIKKLFGNEDYAIKFIASLEANKVEAKALNLSGYQHVKGVVAAHKENEALQEFKEIAEHIL